MWSRKQQLMEEWQRLCETETRMDEEVTPSSLSISTERAEEENRRLKEQVELAKKELEKTKTATVGPTIDDLRASILKTRAARDETKYEVSRMADRIRRQRLETLDVAFVMDASGSMGRYIDAASSKTIQIASWITSEFPEIKSRFAFVAYRDHSNGRERIESKDFCTAEQVSSFASRVKSIRNTDTPEDVLGGLEAALNLDWQAATRLIVWIGDSPCHGSVYHTDEDDYPHGCPRGLTPESIVCLSFWSFYFLSLWFVVETSESQKYRSGLWKNNIRYG